MHHESAEAKEQAAYEAQRREELEDLKKAAAQAAADAGDDDIDGGGEDGGKNQFNYSERAAQTFDVPMRECGVATAPPPVSGFTATVSQWEIYDTYMADYANHLAEADAKAKAESKGKTHEEHGQGAVYDPAPVVAPATKTTNDSVHTDKMGKCLQILERMLNQVMCSSSAILSYGRSTLFFTTTNAQNAEDEIFQDFKYWEDASDAFREGEGSLLPLWRFSTERTKRKQVTAMEWNGRYPDLFAVGYGSYDFMRQGAGMICCFR
jgi:dynein intermediate chain 1, axonemal